jgi:molecular chaperone GrpE
MENQTVNDDTENKEANTEDNVTNLETKKEEIAAEETEVVEEISVEEKLTKELEEWKNKFFYVSAEMENLKKRHQRETDNLLKYGSEKLLKELVAVIDNFDRTLLSIINDEDEKVKNIATGIEMIGKQFVSTLEKSGLSQLDSVGETFDPNFHEALSQIEAEGKEENEIVQEYEKGYVLNGRLLRAAKVVIAK